MLLFDYIKKEYGSEGVELMMDTVKGSIYICDKCKKILWPVPGDANSMMDTFSTTTEAYTVINELRTGLYNSQVLNLCNDCFDEWEKQRDKE